MEVDRTTLSVHRKRPWPLVCAFSLGLIALTATVLVTEEGDVTSPRLVGPSYGEVAIQQVGRNRQIVAAVGGRDAKSPFAASPNAALLHQALYTLLAHADAFSPQLTPDARPAVGSTVLRVNCADVDHQRFVAQMATLGYLPAPR